MFLADGYDAVAMEQIAAAARISKGTLYSRHPSKEALFAAVIEAAVAEWSDEAAQQDHLLTDDIEQRLRHHAHTITASLRRPDVSAFQRLVLSVRDRFPEVARSMHDQGYRYIVDLIAADISAAGAREKKPVRDPVTVAKLLVAAITGRQMQEMAEGDPIDQDDDDFADRVVDLLIAARSNW